MLAHAWLERDSSLAGIPWARRAAASYIVHILVHRFSPQRRVIENAIPAFLFNTKPECAEKFITVSSTKIITVHLGETIYD